MPSFTTSVAYPEARRIVKVESATEGFNATNAAGMMLGGFLFHLARA